MLLFLVSSLLVLINGASYCPSANDFVVMGPSTTYNQGWSTRGSGGVATKAAFNLLGGSVEFDIDFSGTHDTVNANIYTISPFFSGSFTQNSYCDGQKTGDAWCVEIDWIESNGNCGGATTLHTRQGTGNDGCTAWGCQLMYNYNGQSKFHMQITYGGDGSITVTRSTIGNPDQVIQVISQSNYNPSVQGQDSSALVQYYQQRGAVIYSSQWQGWVPGVPGCPTDTGDLGSSFYSVSNLVINGNVVQGPEPSLCSGSNPPPPPPPPTGGNPPPPPPPPPTGGSNCHIAGGNNNEYYYEVQAYAGASVSITCSQGQTVSCSPSQWGDASYFQCWPGLCDNPNPSCGSPITCNIAGGNNNEYYYEVQSVAGASVSIRCNQGNSAQCKPSQWGDASYYQCWPGSVCDGPVPSCSRNGARVEDGSDQQQSGSSSTIPGWGIALIVLGAVVIVAAVIVGVVLLRSRAQAEKP